jgi:hypothetical protein
VLAGVCADAPAKESPGAIALGKNFDGRSEKVKEQSGYFRRNLTIQFPAQFGADGVQLALFLCCRKPYVTATGLPLSCAKKNFQVFIGVVPLVI